MDVDLPTHSSIGSVIGRLVAQHEHLRQLSLDLSGALSASKATVDQARHLSRALGRSDKAVVSDEAELSEPFSDAVRNHNIINLAAAESEDRQSRSPGPVSENRRSRSPGPVETLSSEHVAVEHLLLEARSNWQKKHSRDSRESKDWSSIEHSWQSSAFFPVTDMLGEARKNAIIRLRARLGNRGVISSLVLHNCLRALGLTKYSQQEIDLWVTELKLVSRSHHAELVQNRPPEMRVKFNNRRASIRISGGEGQVRLADPVGRVDIEFKDFATVLLSDTLPLCMEGHSRQMLLTIREILFSGDANRLVAELTQVRVDDVAAPMEKQDLLHKVEPLFTCIILLNGAVIGLQTSDEDNSDTSAGWFWANVAFTLCFVGELVIRARQAGIWEYLFGGERWWNIFDFSLMSVSLCDVVMDGLMTSSAQLAPLGALRVVRLARVTRLFRIFRMKYMRELNLMVRGILGGIYTLFWAVVVLFFTLYVIAVTATFSIRDAELSPEVAADELFSSVPRSLLTSFRCAMGDCNTSRGQPIVLLLSEAYGPGFVLCYLASAIFVHFGLFNLVAAVYVENTMNVARNDGERTWSERRRESVRIARLARQLLKKFCAAQKLSSLDDMGMGTGEVGRALTTSAFDDMGEAWTSISKEMFLCVIQDPSVQKLMDDLDIPPDRAGLFDILDADGSGGLEVTELITGLLRVRGEAKKHDVLGALLAVRAAQDMLREQDSRMGRLERLLEQVHEQLPQRSQRSSRQCSSLHLQVPGGLAPPLPPPLPVVGQGVMGRMQSAVA